MTARPVETTGTVSFGKCPIEAWLLESWAARSSVGERAA